MVCTKCFEQIDPGEVYFTQPSGTYYEGGEAVAPTGLSKRKFHPKCWDEFVQIWFCAPVV